MGNSWLGETGSGWEPGKPQEEQHIAVQQNKCSATSALIVESLTDVLLTLRPAKSVKKKRQVSNRHTGQFSMTRKLRDMSKGSAVDDQPWVPEQWRVHIVESSCQVMLDRDRYQHSGTDLLPVMVGDFSQHEPPPHAPPAPAREAQRAHAAMVEAAKIVKTRLPKISNDHAVLRRIG